MRYKVQQDEEKILWRMLELMSRYPVFQNHFNMIATAGDARNIVLRDQEEAELQTGKIFDLNSFENKFMEFCDVFEEAEKKINQAEQKKNYEMRTFNFNCDQILDHAKKIPDVMNRIIYLRYILKEYPAHLEMRKSFLKIEMDKKLKDDPDFTLKLLKMLNSMHNLFGDLFERVLIPKLKKPLRERINNEISYLFFADSKKVDQETIDEINNPPGVKRWKQTRDQEQEDNQPEDNSLLTIEDAMKLLKVSETTLYHWRKKGKLKFKRIERRLYNRRKDIERAMEQN